MPDVEDPTPSAVDPTVTDTAMTVSEEQLRVGVQARPVTRAVLRKYIVTEEVTRTFTIRREEVRLEQMPVADDATAAARPSFEPEEYVIVLHEERPVISTEVVPVERVRLIKGGVHRERRDRRPAPPGTDRPGPGPTARSLTDLASNSPADRTGTHPAIVSARR